MRQKVALTAAHLLSEGRIADMGMGSGTGSEALAALYPALDVVGVDLDPTMVELATERYELANLSFRVGDIARPVFEPGSLDGILDSSVLHHVTSFNGYVAERAAEAIEAQVVQLRDHGVLIVRDFVDPGGGDVLLDVPADDGDDGDDPRSCSTAALFERFAGEFRLLADAPGFEYQAIEGASRSDWKRYLVAAKLAAEFVLRKDYRRDWEKEVAEEYTYFTQDQFEDLYARLGLRVLTSTPIRNPWIVRNRFRGKLELRSPSGAELEFPATNFIIAGEKVPAGHGVRFREGAACEPAGFLSLGCYRERRSGRVMDLVRRPNCTIDVVPWFEDDGDRFVLARASYPRPIERCKLRGTRSLGGARAAGYVVEPLVVVQADKPMAMTVEEALSVDAGVEPARIRSFGRGTTYYPSPGGIQEQVRSAFVEIAPQYSQRPLENRSGFSSSGRVLAIEAQQLLRAAQVGGLPDARLELNAYDLLLGGGRPVGPWIADEIELADGVEPAAVVELATLLERPRRRRFEAVEIVESSGFLELRCARFEELDADGQVLGGAALELVVPRSLSHNTITTALVRRHHGEACIGVDDDDLPAAQGFVGGSELLITPAWRLPRETASMTAAIQWIRDRVAAEYGLECGEAWELGGRYFPSLGITPEVVHPIAFAVVGEGRGERPLSWVRLAELVAERDRIREGHLRIASLRAAHALGLL